MQRLSRWVLAPVARGVRSNGNEAKFNLRFMRNFSKEAPNGAMPQFAGLPPIPPVGAYQPMSPLRRIVGTFIRIFLPVTGASILWYGFTHPDDDPLVPTRLPPELQWLASQQTRNEQTFSNWSGTHEAKPTRVFQPQTEAEVEQFLRMAARHNSRLRVAGSMLSPNGLALSEEGMLSMALMDKVLSVDPDKRQVTVQAGCRVQQLADALKPYGLTLQNYASIREQQVGGFTQVGAHGTGARIPPVDDSVVGMRLVSPALGAFDVSDQEEPELFSLAKVGLGALGVVSQLTLSVVPRHQLLERTFTASVAEVKKNHVKWLREYQHLRYMWLPYTDTVVVVASSTVGKEADAQALAQAPPAFNEQERLAPFRDLAQSRAPELAQSLSGLSATQMRDTLLAKDPLNKEWVASVNTAEAEFWKRSSGHRVGYSDEVLGFDCGGQQWVMEVCFPVGKLDKLKGVTKDLEFMENLMAEIKRNKIPAPCPIEQRWSCGSSSAMSPAVGPADSVFSWVGVIMYLPQEEAQRAAVTEAFQQYSQLVQDKLGPRYGATAHWAKLEAPATAGEAATLRARLAKRFPLQRFNEYRAALDPQGVLSNEWLDSVVGKPPAVAASSK